MTGKKYCIKIIRGSVQIGVLFACNFFHITPQYTLQIITLKNGQRLFLPDSGGKSKLISILGRSQGHKVLYTGCFGLQGEG